MSEATIIENGTVVTLGDECRVIEDGAVSDPEYDEAFHRAWQSADLQEGITAFRERRTPHFEGR